jgi:membrane-associated phospholipid phosphatase
MWSKIADFYKTLTPPDLITAVFSGFMAMLILYRMQVIGTDVALTYAGCYGTVFLFILLIVPLLDRSTHALVQNPVVRFCRNLYPAFLLGAFFTWTEPVSHMFYSQPFDPILVKLDIFLFGFNPGRDLVHILGDNYWLSEYMNFAYLSFYLTPWLVIYFYAAKKQKEFYYTAFVCALVMYTTYVLQSIFPVQGPIYNDPAIGHHIVAGPISAFAANFLSNADVPGSAMPSGHIAGTISVLFLTWQMFRKAFWVTAPLWISLCIATVYGHFHYAVDGLAAIMLAIVGVFFAGPAIYCRLFPDLVPESIAQRRPEAQEDESVLNPGTVS